MTRVVQTIGSLLCAGLLGCGTAPPPTPQPITSAGPPPAPAQTAGDAVPPQVVTTPSAPLRVTTEKLNVERRD